MKRVFSVILLSMMCVSMFIVPVCAHAGGSVGGGGSSSGGSSSSNNNHDSSNGGGGIFSIIPFLGFIALTTYAGAYVLHKKHRESRRMMKMLEKQDPVWNEKKINDYVSDVFYKIQQAWMDMDIEKLKEYLTPALAEEWDSKFAWMRQREEVSIMKDIQLKEREIVGVYDYVNDREDFVWYYIKATMIDYTVNVRTNEVMQGDSTNPITFEEYWKFKRFEDMFYLDDVMGIDEVEAGAFRAYSESQENQDA